MQYLITGLLACLLTLSVVGCSHTLMKGESGNKKATMKTYGMENTGVIVTDDIVEIHAKKHQAEKDL